MNVTVIRLLPPEVEAALEAFLVAGKYGDFTVHVNAGSIESWTAREIGRVKKRGD